MKLDHDQASDRGKVAGIGMLMAAAPYLSTLGLPTKTAGRRMAEK